MSRKKSKKPAPTRAQQKAASARRKFLERAAVVAGVMVVSGGGYAAYRVHYNNTYNLSIIGNGSPTVVQIHDPGCDACKLLKSNVESVKREFEDIQFRVVTIGSSEGARFARKHRAKKTTLLIFDGGGKLIDKMEGVFPQAQLRKRFAKL